MVTEAVWEIVTGSNRSGLWVFMMCMARLDRIEHERTAWQPLKAIGRDLVEVAG
jgi:hypothetical protein